MRIHKALTQILSSPMKVGVLRLFCKTNKPMHGREIARELGATHPLVNRTLKQLEGEGLLTCNVYAKMLVYKLNTELWITDLLLKPLFREEEQIPDRLMSAIGNNIKTSEFKDEILSVAVFGSIYRQEEKPASDIDLLIIIADKRKIKAVENFIFDVDKKIYPKIRLSLEPHVYSLLEFKRQYSSPKRMPFLVDAIKNHRICYGKRLEVL